MLRLALVLSLFVASESFASPVEDDSIQIPCENIAYKKARKKKKRGWHIGPQGPTWNVFNGMPSYGQYITKVRGRETLLTLAGLVVEGKYCLISTELLKKPIVLETVEQVRQHFATGDDIPAIDRDKCVVCEDHGAAYAGSRCGHYCLCQTCAEQIDKCPLCREDNQNWIKIFRR